MGQTHSSTVSAEIDYFEDNRKLRVEEWTVEHPVPREPMIPLSRLQKEVEKIDPTISRYLLAHFPSDAWFSKELACLHWRALSPLYGVTAMGFHNTEDGLERSLFLRARIGEKLEAGSVADRVSRTFHLGDNPGQEVKENKYPIFLPQNLGRRLFYIFIVDRDQILLAKAKVIMIFNDDFTDEKGYLGASLIERQDRMTGIAAYVKLPSASESPSILSMYSQPDLQAIFKFAATLPRPPIQYWVANDGTHLAYRTYVHSGRKPEGCVIFITLNSFFQDPAAHRLAQEYPLRAYVCEIRGHGYSGGVRGDAKSKEAVLGDVRSFVRMVRFSHPSSMPIYILGHFHAASMLLNYDSWREKEPVSGYIFLAPQMCRAAMDTWRRETFDGAKKSNMVKPHVGNIKMAMATKGLFRGNEPALEFAVPDELYEADPMFVDRLTTTLFMAVAAPEPKKQFESCSVPFCFLVGEMDEFFNPEVLIKYPHANTNPRNEVRILPNLTNLGILLDGVPTFAEWILKEIREAHSEAPEETSSLRGSKYSSGEEPDTDEILDSRQEYSISAEEIPFYRETIQYLREYQEKSHLCPPIQYLEGPDGARLAYQRFDPPYSAMTGEPSSVLVLWLEWSKGAGLLELASALNMIIYRFDLRGTGKSDGPRGQVSSKKILWSDIRHTVIFAKRNHPQVVVFLGGHSIGASMVLNYSGWKDAEPPHAYLMFSAALNPYLPHHAVFSKPDVFRFLNCKKNRSFMFPFRSTCSTATITPDPRLKEIHPGMGLELSSDYIKGTLAKDIVEQFLAIEIPFGAWWGAEDEFIYAERIVDAVCSLSKAPMHVAELVPGANHLSIMRNPVAFVGPWINRVSTSLNPRPSIVLTAARINDFEIIELVGKGTFGQVWLVRHRESEKYLAMKVLRKGDVIKNGLTEQVLREKSILDMTSNPFIVPFVGSFHDTRHLYLLMEFLVGGELYTLLRVHDKLPISWVRFYAAEILIALMYLHENGIIYRDLKPENILLDALGHVRLIDFGLARELESSSYATTFCGSPFYMAPEMISSRLYSFPTDLWSYGVVIFELLTGTLPFNGRTPTEIYRRILFGKIEWPSSMDPDARDLISKLLEQDPGKRLGSQQPNTTTSNSSSLPQHLSSLSLGSSTSSTQTLGYIAIMKHKFFKGVDWDQIKERQMAPPFQPAVRGDADTGNFIKYHNIPPPSVDDAEPAPLTSPDMDDPFLGF